LLLAACGEIASLPPLGIGIGIGSGIGVGFGIGIGIGIDSSYTQWHLLRGDPCGCALAVMHFICT
jgi:hypothetical protein